MILKLPKTMKAIDISCLGDQKVLKVASLPMPLPGSYDVLIKVEAAGVNRADILQRKGLYPPPLGASSILGLEVAGRIVAIGEKVTRFKGEERVCALLEGGGYAEYCVASELQCLPIPKGLTTIEAASLPEAYFTVWDNLFDHANLKKHEKVLIHGGSSGVGGSALSLCSALGIEVYATAGSDEKCRFCERIGAKKAINYKTQDFVEVIKQDTNNKGVDVILDMVGGDYVLKETSILEPEGRLIFIAAMGGTAAVLNLKDVISKRLTLLGSTLRNQSAEFKGRIAQSLQEFVWPLIEASKIKPLVYEVFDFDKVAQAHALMESNAHMGKIVLRGMTEENNI
jgi:putative PIG3 family NAD(P)H quinone oxidoreductase